MARELATIEKEINDEAASYLELKALQDNPSMASIWGYAKKTFALSALTLEKLFDELKAEINATIDVTETGSLTWYRSIAAAYQHGHPLIVSNNRPAYNTIDPSARILSKCVVVELLNDQTNYPYLWVAVAKGKGPAYTQLSSDELNGFRYYMERVKIAGTPITVTSMQAEEVKITLSVTLSSSLFNQQGKSLANPSQEPVRNAMVTYLSELGEEAVFYQAALIDKIMNTTGVIDVKINEAPNHQFIGAGYATLRADSSIAYTLK